MKSNLKTGEVMKIINEGNILQIYDSEEKELLFELSAPENAAFYQFANHIEHGECPIVSFMPDHKINGWMDWYYKIDIKKKSMSRVNPWR